MSPLALSAPAATPRLPRPLVLAVGASVGLHLLALAWQQAPRLAADTPPPPLHVVLRTAAPIPEPAAPPPPAPIAVATPRPLAPPPLARAKPVDAPRPTPVLTRPASNAPAPQAPTPGISVATAPTSAPTPAPAASPAVDSVAPHAPVARAEALAPSAPATDEAPDPAQLERYGRSLSSALARQQNYPRLAALRGWEGEVQLRVTIARKGNVIATQVVRSSGFEILDQNAVQLIAAAGPLPRPPESLQNREIQVIVPVHYKLEKPT